MARKEKKPKTPKGPKGVPAYMLTYGDMMTLLVCFFVLIISMSTMEVEKIKQAAASLKGAFSTFPFQDKVIPSPIEQTNPALRGEKRGRRSRAIAKLRRLIREQKLQDIIKVREQTQGIHITIGDPALFDTGKAAIKPAILPILNQIVEVVASGGEVIRVEGHTDNVPIHTPQFGDNWELSIARALSVIRHIRQGQQFDPKRLRPVGCGEFHPIASNDTEEGKALNRRVEIYIEMSK